MAIRLSFSDMTFDVKITAVLPLDTGRKLNVHSETLIKYPESEYFSWLKGILGKKNVLTLS